MYDGIIIILSIDMKIKFKVKRPIYRSMMPMKALQKFKK